MSESEPKAHKSIEDKGAKIESEKKKFGEKSEKLNKKIESKGGWAKFKEEKLPYVFGAGALLLLAAGTGLFLPFTFFYTIFKIFS